jgi:hypothetical protein
VGDDTLHKDHMLMYDKAGLVSSCLNVEGEPLCIQCCNVRSLIILADQREKDARENIPVADHVFVV